jgi:Xaa-Pro aminopeptidase
LFLEPGDPVRVVWDGARLPPGSVAKKHFGVHATAPASALKERVLVAAERAGGRLAMLWREREPGYQSLQVPVWRRRLRGVKMVNAEEHAVPLRMIKDADEIRWHKRAVKVTAAGLKTVMRQLPQMKRECEVAGELLRHYVGASHDPIAFDTIVGGGVNAATLHYPHNDGALPAKGCVLIDSGATAGGYCADVTRTLPHHGRFDRPRFRELYELVLRCQELGRKHAKPGITLEELNAIAWTPLTDAGLTRHHGLSHHIGIEVHDPSDRTLPLAPGMLISNEPGVYLPDEQIGIRIEDDLLITASGNENTTRAIPKTIAAIEAAMG